MRRLGLLGLPVVLLSLAALAPPAIPSQRSLAPADSARQLLSFELQQHALTYQLDASGQARYVNVKTSRGLIAVRLDYREDALVGEVALRQADGTVVDRMSVSLGRGGLIDIVYGVRGEFSGFWIGEPTSDLVRKSRIGLYEVSGFVDCKALGDGPLWNAIRDLATDLSESSGAEEDLVGSLQSSGLAGFAGLLGASAHAPPLAGGCDLEPLHGAKNAICGSAGSFEACTSCCANESLFASLVCLAIGRFDGGACGALMIGLAGTCDQQCVGLPPAPGQGGGCTNFCPGTCYADCPPGTGPGPGNGDYCSSGLECCVPISCGDE